MPEVKIQYKTARGAEVTLVQRLMLVHTKHREDRTPALCTLLRRDGKIDVSAGETWMSVWVPEEAVAPKEKVS